MTSTAPSTYAYKYGAAKPAAFAGAYPYGYPTYGYAAGFPVAPKE